ncbi:MAG: hypothetical protein ACYCOR_16150 [Acidobacteriaceae bacterium]
MLGRVLAAHGVAVLLLTMPPGVLAQLPDAPQPVGAAQTAALQADGGGPSFQTGLERERTARAGVLPLKPLETAGSRVLSNGVSSSETGSQPADWAMEDAPEGQESFAPASRRKFKRALSSSTAYLGEIPGSAPALQSDCLNNACPAAPPDMCCWETSLPFAQYLGWPGVVPLTARDNLRSAVKGIIDPFNLITIAGDAAVGIGSDAHTPYGPGFRGFAKYSGVSLTEDMTGEFFGTFLVPSLMHQDPHYHREPFLPIKRRILHAIVQVVWTQSYTGQPMFNYANVVGGIATAAVSNTFVPGPGRQGFGNTAQRLALAFAISPSGNLIEEFVPDLASHINLRVVIFQRILNSVTLEESGVPQ